MPKSSESKQKPNLISVIKSIFAAGIGVQSDKNRTRDFQQGNPLTFIVGGIVFTLLFIATVATVVGFVLSNS